LHTGDIVDRRSNGNLSDNGEVYLFHVDRVVCWLVGPHVLGFAPTANGSAYVVDTGTWEWAPTHEQTPSTQPRVRDQGRHGGDQ
jgi:hypothetical protein